MAIRFACTRCGHRLRAEAAQAGRHGQCTRCGHSMTIPEVPAPRNSRWRVVALASAGLVAVAGILIGVLYWYGANSVPHQLKNVKNGSSSARVAALTALAEADPQDQYRDQVTAALEPIVFEGDVPGDLNPDLVLRTYLHWANPNNVPALLRMVDNPTLPAWSPQKTGLVLQALGKLQSEKALPILAGHLANSALRDDAVAALKLAGPSATDAVLEYAFDKDSATRERANDLLASYETPFDTIAKAALERLSDNEPLVRLNAAQWCADNSPAEEKQKSRGAKLLLPLLDSLSPKTNQVGLRALRRWATKEYVPQLVAFAQRLSKAPPTKETTENKRLLIDILAQFSEPDAAAAIALSLRDPALQDRAVQALLKLGPVSADAVLPYIDDPNPAVSKQARSLGQILQPTVDDQQLSQILTDLADSKKHRTQAALTHLAKMRPDAAHRPAVSKALNGPLLDPDLETVNKALDAVLIWGSTENTPAMLQLLGNLDGPKVDEPARKVVAALSALGPSVEDGVIPFLKSPNPRIRAEACWILGDVGTSKSLKPLQDAPDMYISDKQFFNEAVTARQKIEMRK